MTWRQFIMELGEMEPAAVEAVLADHGALSVTYTDAADSPVLEPGPGEAPLWPDTRVTALFADELDAAALGLALMARLGLAAPPRFHVQPLRDRLWEREWLADFAPMRFGRRLWVCPGGMTVDQSEAIVIRLDPGLAFGTGTHPTTALCLEWLDAMELAGREVLDYGCGSGILAIAALLCGAASASGVDIDPQALTASRENARTNDVQELLFLARPRELPPVKRFDVVLANILAQPLIELAPTLAAHTRNGGTLALSGILREQADAVAAAYGRWYRMEASADREGWSLLTGTRHGN